MKHSKLLKELIDKELEQNTDLSLQQKNELIKARKWLDQANLTKKDYLNIGKLIIRTFAHLADYLDIDT